ncbi:hypothetical protein ACFX1X_012193 [Malus domestica]
MGRTERSIGWLRRSLTLRYLLSNAGGCLRSRTLYGLGLLRPSTSCIVLFGRLKKGLGLLGLGPVFSRAESFLLADLIGKLWEGKM